MRIILAKGDTRYGAMRLHVDQLPPRSVHWDTRRA
jgi:hypothetical protein